jgi:transposase
MRGEERRQRAMLMIMEPGDGVPGEHPLRGVKELADAALGQLSPLFDERYSLIGRPAIPPERLLKASLLLALYTVRSERMLCEQLDYNLLFRWFLDMDVAAPSFDHSTFSRNRARLLEHDVAREFFTRVVAQARSLQLLSDEHLTVDGTLVEAWASLKSCKRKDREPSQPPDHRGNPTVNFHGERRRNATHQSTTDPEAKLAKKGAGKEAKLCYSANALMENRNGLLIEFAVEPADGYAERKSARAMLETALPGSRRITLGADKGYDTAEFVAACRALKVTPHIARNEGRAGGSALDPRTARHPGHAVSQRVRKRVEEIFGWMKTVGGLRRTRYRGLDRTQLHAYRVAAAYNLLRIARLSPASA